VSVPKFVCEVVYASGFAWSMDGDVPWDTRSIVRKARPNSVALEKGNLGTHMRATEDYVIFKLKTREKETEFRIPIEQLVEIIPFC
jgi:hypothetical protein